MVKLVRVERSCEITGSVSCPLAPSQRPEYTPLHSATRVVIVSAPARPNTPVITLDSRYKAKLGILFVKPFAPRSV